MCAAANNAGRNARANIRILSTFDLEHQIGSDEAMDRRREHHVEHGDAARQPDGRIAYRRNLIATLQEREVARAGEDLAAQKSLPFRAAADGETVTGTFTGTTQLSSGKFAIVEKSHEFTLVPWRPVIDRKLGREVPGIVRGGSVS